MWKSFMAVCDYRAYIRAMTLEDKGIDNMNEKHCTHYAIKSHLQ